jgi:hypothetical protein
VSGCNWTVFPALIPSEMLDRDIHLQCTASNNKSGQPPLLRSCLDRLWRQSQQNYSLFQTLQIVAFTIKLIGLRDV